SLAANPGTGLAGEPAAGRNRGLDEKWRVHYLQDHHKAGRCGIEHRGDLLDARKFPPALRSENCSVSSALRFSYFTQQCVAFGPATDVASTRGRCARSEPAGR